MSKSLLNKRREKHTRLGVQVVRKEWKPCVFI